MKKLIFIPVLVTIFSFSFASAALADTPTAPVGVRIDNVLNPGGIVDVEFDGTDPIETARRDLVRRITNVILTLAGVVAVFFIINNAWFIVASAGSEEAITTHKKGLMWALVGLILIILSYSIIRFIASIPFQAGQEVPQSSGTASGTTGPGGAGAAGGSSLPEIPDTQLQPPSETWNP